MRDPVRNRERLEHIKDAIERIQDNIKTVSLDNLSSNVLAFLRSYNIHDVFTKNCKSAIKHAIGCKQSDYNISDDMTGVAIGL